MERDLILLFKEMTLRQIAVQVVDVLIVAYIIYRLLLMVRGTRAWRILIGIFVFVFLLWASETLRLSTVHWLLDKATLLGPVALAILFLPELRQAIEGLTKFSFLPQTLVTGTSGVDLDRREIDEIVAAVGELAEDRVGALLVIEKDGRLDEIASSGVALGATVSKELLLALFYGENPLHDGAALVRGEKVVAAACRLPLSESTRLDGTLHMRHRAGVGVTEVSDAIAVIVSEERGTVSLAHEGRLRRMAGLAELREKLRDELTKEEKEETRTPRRRRGRVDAEASPLRPEESADPATGDDPVEAGVPR